MARNIVTRAEFEEHKDKHWQVVHGIWPNIRSLAGIVGPKGAIGIFGNTGPQGPEGDPGPMGNTGPQGPTGPGGVTGPQGTIGESGPTGVEGPAGVTGPQGVIGPSGPTGAIGPTGVEGAQGAAGESGMGAALVDPDCVAYWPIVRGSGDTIYDKSGNEIHGTLYPTPVPISACDVDTDWSGTDLSIDTGDKKEGTGSLKDTVATPVIDTNYHTSYNPTSSWDWSDKKHILFWLKSDRVNTAFTTTFVRIYDTSGNWRVWNLTFSAGEWTAFKFLLSTGDGQSATPPDLALINYVQIRFRTADTTPFYKKIDDLRIDDRPQWAIEEVSGACLDFDGVDDYVEVPDDGSLNLTDKVSVSGWFKGVAGVGDQGHLVCKGTGTYPPYKIYINSSGALVVQGSSDGTGWDYLITSSVLSEDWHHFAMTFSTDNGMILYIDGEVAGTDTTKTALVSTEGQNLFLGMQGLNDRFLDGFIDEVRIYNRELTETEVGFLLYQIYLTGAQGEQGPTGVTGVQGPQGITGPQGEQGPQGVTGVQGNQGVTGTQGTQGPTGVDGVEGSQGPTGAEGDQGIPGISSTSIASDTLKNSNDAERTSVAVSYFKKKETKLIADMGKIRIYFELKASVGQTAYGKIYKNGSPLGTERSTVSSGAFVDFSEDEGPFVKDDLIQIYVKTTADTVYVRRLRMQYETVLPMTNQDP